LGTIVLYLFSFLSFFFFFYLFLLLPFSLINFFFLSFSLLVTSAHKKKICFLHDKVSFTLFLHCYEIMRSGVFIVAIVSSGCFFFVSGTVYFKGSLQNSKITLERLSRSGGNG